MLQSDRYRPRHQTDAIRTFVRETASMAAHRSATFRALDAYDKYIRNELDAVASRVDALKAAPNVDVFAADATILERSIALTSRIRLQPFDLNILASVLVKAEGLRRQDLAVTLAFCDLDRDLQPWTKDGQTRVDLTALYDDAHVWVYGDFTMQKPERPDGWPIKA